MRAGIYARVSQEGLTYDNQVAELLSYADSKGYQVVGTWGDIEHGDVPAGLRGGFSEMLKAAHARQFDILLVWAWDRLTRGGIGAAFSIMSQLKGAGVLWHSRQEPFLSSESGGPMNELLLAIIAWVAEFEKARIRDRTKAALARRKALGLPVGRPKGSADSSQRVRRYQKAPAMAR